MKNNLLIIIILFTLIPFGIKAQQEPQFSQYWFNKVNINPGYVGLNDAICADVLIRRQWSKISGSPETNYLSINSPFEPFGLNSGIGFVMFQDDIGGAKRSNFKLSYSYHLPIANGTLGLGFDAGLFSFDLNTKFSPVKTDDPVLINNDAFQEYKFDLGIGAYYKSKDMYAGFSIDNVTSPVISNDAESTSSDFIQMRRHTYMTGGYTLQLPIPLLELTPSFNLKSVIGKKGFVGTQIDLTALLTYNDKFWGGLSYRLQDSFVAIIGLELFNGLKAGFSYDIPISKLARFGGGATEIYLGYCFEWQKQVKQKKYKSVRFL